jgi:hypothetical protein
MKKYITVITLLTASLFMVGCTTVAPLLTPAQLTSDVSGGIKIALDVSPSSAPDVALARDVICSAASSTNSSPAAIVADLATLNITNTTSKVIVDAGFLAYENVYALIGTNTTSQIQPYLAALCDGFTVGLSPVTANAKASRQILPPHLK